MAQNSDHRPTTVRARWWLLGLVLAALALTAGCSESRARKLVDHAESLARAGKYHEAVAILQRVENDYGGTRAAAGAHAQILLCQGLLEAEAKKTRRRGRDEILALARALLDYREKSGRYPASLADLPAHGSLPKRDPWGREYRYEAASNGTGYRLQCLGADGARGGAGDDKDLLARNGVLVEDLAWEDR